MEPVRVALVGFGNAAVAFHLPLIGPLSNTVLSGVVARSERCRLRVRHAYPQIALAANLPKLMEIVPAVELVVIATPPDSHSTLTREALSLGRHVLVEKPFCSDSREARALVAYATRRRLVVSCFLNRRFDGDFRTVAEALEHGDVGKPIRLLSTWERPGPPSSFPEVRWFAPTTNQGGLLGTGYHLVDQALQLLGPATRVTAHRYGVGWEEGDNVSSIAIEHIGGSIAQLLITSSAQRFRRRLELVGTAGQLDIQCLDQRDLRFAGGAATLSVRGTSKAIALLPETWSEAYRGLAKSIREGTRPPISADDVLTVQDVLDACLESAERRTTVSV